MLIKIGLVMIIISRELFYTINLRQAYRRSPWGASRLSSRTILFTSVPKTLGEQQLFEMFPGVKHAWVASNCKELTKLVEDRDDTALKLEAAEVQLSRDANANRIKVAKGKKAYSSGEGVDQHIDPKKRPTHKLKFLIGKKVDTITYGREHLAELIPKIEAHQLKHWQGEADLVGAVFVTFDTQRSAQDAWQMMQSRKTKPNKKIAARQLGVLPQEVVWNNLRIGTAEHWVRWLLASAFITVMIVFFAVPGKFVVAGHEMLLTVFSRFRRCCVANQLPDCTVHLAAMDQQHPPCHSGCCHRSSSRRHARHLDGAGTNFLPK
jgi:hypothetical protein